MLPEDSEPVVTGESDATKPGATPPAPATTGRLSVFKDQYAPGPIRRATDREAVVVERFLKYAPEFVGQPHDVILQHLELHRPDFEHEERDMLADEGVPVDDYDGERSVDVSDDGPEWSDDL